MEVMVVVSGVQNGKLIILYKGRALFIVVSMLVGNLFLRLSV